jgi:hypothetical protein
MTLPVRRRPLPVLAVTSCRPDSGLPMTKTAPPLQKPDEKKGLGERERA